MMDRNKKQYTNGEITVYWKPSECIHSTICYKNLISVFNPSERPWISMKGASTAKIIDIVKRCPTDALTYTWNNGDKSDKPPKDFLKFAPENRDPETDSTTKIEIVHGGPLLIKGDLEIKFDDGSIIRKSKITNFCRCGGSMNMPFCDGTHRKINFDK